jgi:hypothetical protein
MDHVEFGGRQRAPCPEGLPTAVRLTGFEVLSQALMAGLIEDEPQDFATFMAHQRKTINPSACG